MVASLPQHVSGALCALLVNLLPPSVRDDYSLGLLRDLGAVASSMIASGTTNSVLFESLCTFLDEFIVAHGEAIDTGTTSVLRATSGFAGEREIFRLAEGLFLSAIEYALPALGEDWTRPAEQREGQAAVESQDAGSLPKRSEATTECLSTLLPLLQTCLDLAPVFLAYLPARPGVDREQDMLLRRAIDSTVGSLNDTDSELVIRSISLLETMVRASVDEAAEIMIRGDTSSHLYPSVPCQLKQESSQNEQVRSLVSNEVTRVYPDIVNRLILGCCGHYELCVLEKVSSYLHTLLSLTTSVEQLFVTALRQEHFALGDDGARAALTVFGRCAARRLDQDALRAFLEEVWTIHRAEDRNALPHSDAVAQLLRRYS